MGNLQMVQRAILLPVLRRTPRAPEDPIRWCSLAEKGNGEGGRREWWGAFRRTYFQRGMVSRESGGKEVDMSTQEQKWRSTVLIFVNTFQILEDKQHLNWKIIMDGRRAPWHGQSSLQVTSKQRAEETQGHLWALSGCQERLPMLAWLLLSRDRTWATALISSAVIFLELWAEYFFLFFPPRQKSMWCYLMWQASFPIISISFKEKHPTQKYTMLHNRVPKGLHGEWGNHSECVEEGDM